MKYPILAIFILSFAAAQHRERSVTPLAGISVLRANGETVTGPRFGLQFLSRESNGERWGFSGGLLFQLRGTQYTAMDPYIPNQNDQPTSFGPSAGPRVSNGLVRQSNIALSGGFVGADWMIYLADGSVRPYAGLSLYAVLLPFNQSMTGTIAPAVRAGLEANIRQGFNGFAEVQHLVGTPTVFGNRASLLEGITSVNVGFSFAPRFLN